MSCEEVREIYETKLEEYREVIRHMLNELDYDMTFQQFVQIPFAKMICHCRHIAWAVPPGEAKAQKMLPCAVCRLKEIGYEDPVGWIPIPPPPRPDHQEEDDQEGDA